MGERTTIEWVGETGKTFNPWLGCDPKHTGCLNMGIKGKRRRTSKANWKKPLAWNKKAILEHAARLGWTARPRVFPSLCDPFEDWASNAPPQSLMYWRSEFFQLIDRTPNLDWLLLTKRPENIRKMWTLPMNGRDPAAEDYLFRDNVWLLYSASDQETLDAGLPHLLGCCDLVPVLGLSLEPLVGPIDLSRWIAASSPVSSWVICGGESGPNARPCNVEWILSIIEQCRLAGVPCFVKQLGRTPYVDDVSRSEWASMRDREQLGPGLGYRVKLKHPKGGDPDEWPEPLRVQQYPEVNHG